MSDEPTERDVETLAEVIGAAYYDSPEFTIPEAADGPHFLNAARAVVVLLAARNRCDTLGARRGVDEPIARDDEAEKLARVYFESLGWEWDALLPEDRQGNTRRFLPVADHVAERIAAARREGERDAVTQMVRRDTP